MDGIEKANVDNSCTLRTLRLPTINTKQSNDN